MSTQHDTPNGHTCYKKNRPPFVGEGGKEKKLEILQNIQVWKILPAEVRTSRPGRGSEGVVFVHRWVHTKQAESCRCSVHNTSILSVRWPALQKRSRSRRRSSCWWVDSLRQPVQRAEGLRDEGQESSARISPVLPVWDRVLQRERLQLVDILIDSLADNAGIVYINCDYSHPHCLFCTCTVVL